MDILYGAHEDDGRLDETEYAQPAVFAIECALAALWRSCGIEPAFVMGHSLGEYAAACVAGVFSLEDGFRLVTERGRLMASVPAGGAMAVVFAGEETVRRRLATFEDVEVAGVNGPANVVISGPREDVESVLSGFGTDGVESRALSVSNGFHSARMEPILASFEAVVDTAVLREPEIPVVSTLTGVLAKPGQLSDPKYWSDHLRHPVLFQQAVETLVEEGVTDFLEAGPHSTLLGMARECVPPDFGFWFPSMRRDKGNWEQLAESAAGLWLRNAPLDWSALDGEYSRRRVSLPTYPFQRDRHWIEPRSAAASPLPTSAGPAHPFLDGPLRSPAIEAKVYQGSVGGESRPSLDDHRVEGEVVFPMTGYLDLALSAARDGLGLEPDRLTDVVVSEPLVIAPGSHRRVQVILQDDPSEPIRWEIFSSSEDEGEPRWTRHAAGRVWAESPAAGGSALGTDPESEAPFPLSDVRARCPTVVDPDAFYDRVRACGLDYGPAFMGVHELRRGDGEALGRIEIPHSVVDELGGHVAHPALLDACLQVAMAPFVAREDEAGDSLFLPVGVGTCQLDGPLPASLWAHARERSRSEDGRAREYDIVIYDAEGEVVGRVESILLRPVQGSIATRSIDRRISDWFYEPRWQPVPRPALRGPRVSPLASPEVLTTSPRVTTVLADELRDLEYDGIQEDLDLLIAEYTMHALLDLGVGSATDASTEGLRRHLGIAPEHERMLERMLEILAEEGVSIPLSERCALMDTDPSQRLASLRERSPSSFEPMWRVIERCGEGLARVLSGEEHAVDLLFPGGSITDLESLYSASPFAQAYNSVVCRVVEELIRDVPAGGPLRILEVGAGTGGTTAQLLPLLEGRCTLYLYTDVSRLFLARARDKFGSRGFVQYEVFDLTMEPEAQGIDLGSFDLVVASNVLHATPRLDETLRRLRSALKPGGVVLAVEGVVKQRWVDLIFGLTEGWWLFEDEEVRSSYPLVAPSTWESVLGRSGFEAVACLPGAEASSSGIPTIFGQAVIAARSKIGTQGLDLPTEAPEWLVLTAPDDDFARSLVQALRSQGDRCDLVLADRTGDGATRKGMWVDPERPEELRSLFEAREATGCPYRGVIYLLGLADDTPGVATPDAHDFEKPTIGLLHLVQAMVVGEREQLAPLWIVTRGAKSVGVDEPVSGLAGSPLWGFGQVVGLEHPELRVTSVDLDPNGDDRNVESLLSELGAEDAESQTAFRDGGRFVARLRRPEADLSERSRGAVGRGGAAVRLETTRPGSLADLQLVPLERREPGPGEVEIAVAATGLNFRDVLSALDMYPGDPGPLGGECAGIVSRVGEGVTGLRTGEPVLAFAQGAFSTHVTVSAHLVVRKPALWTFDRAASAIGSFLTADVALNVCAGLREGQRVLIHCGAGGVGLSAIEIAKAVRAEIFSTASTEEKREFLRSSGVSHAMNSRDTAFADRVMEITAGQGVDVVVNSLAGDAIDASLRVTADDGCFVELGKNEVRTPDEVRALERGIDYHLIDVAQMAAEEPQRIGARIQSVVAALERGELAPLPTRAFSLSKAETAFRYMAQARQIGKVVVRNDARSVDASVRDAVVPGKGVCLIVGGLGGLGLLLARWMVDRGVPGVVLMGRSEPSDHAKEVIAGLERQGASIVVERGDVTSEDDVRGVLDRIDASGASLSGIVHAAGVLEDGVLLQQTSEKLSKVMTVKVGGSWNLHRLTADRDLDYFILFSSIASVLGSPGQSNHCAANAFLDSLAAYRRSRGLPGLAINWGAWSELGAAADEDLQARLASRGLGTIAPELGVRAFELALDQSEPQIAVVPADWSRHPNSPLVQDLATVTRARPPASADAPVVSLATRLESAPVGQRHQLVSDFVRDRVADGLGFGSEQVVDPTRPLSEFGLDSLLAVELRNSLSAGLGMDRGLPATLLFDHPSLENLTRYLADEVLGLERNRPRDEPADTELDEIASLSDEEAEALLVKELDGLE